MDLEFVTVTRNRREISESQIWQRCQWRWLMLWTCLLWLLLCSSWSSSVSFMLSLLKFWKRRIRNTLKLKGFVNGRNETVRQAMVIYPLAPDVRIMCNWTLRDYREVSWTNFLIGWLIFFKKIIYPQNLPSHPIWTVCSPSNNRKCVQFVTCRSYLTTAPGHLKSSESWGRVPLLASRGAHTNLCNFSPVWASGQA